MEFRRPRRPGSVLLKGQCVKCEVAGAVETPEVAEARDMDCKVMKSEQSQPKREP